ncbi:Six-hairpin glycosidase [Thelephora terrestris]|uniref:Six-hairpin glycosidase n=1 Tax=Thelephora terrestris TaxID=56493 RepID=A0A9P6H4P2_9AGAM|nr:Six-hairpin glycosidase [Thelephora terrestris]
MRKAFVLSLLVNVGEYLTSRSTTQKCICTTNSSPTRPPASSPADGFTLDEVRSNAIASSQKSWELGTLTEALLEYSWPQLSVFNAAASIPPARDLFTSDYPTDVVNIATTVVQNKPNDSLPLMPDTAVGDPASIGPAVLLANWTRNDTNDARFSTAAGSQLSYLLTQAPRTSDGAISQRNDQVQLWSDFVYMAPPFIASFGAYEQDDANKTYLLQAAYDQCRLYRQYLQDNSTKLWKHIEFGSYQDNNLWATGNGWAVAGMLRVRQTISLSDVSGSFVNQQNDLLNWIEEIVKASWIYQTSDGALRNVINNSSSFKDSSSTALIASATFRLAVLKRDNSTYISSANAAYDFVIRNIDSSGWLRNTVDPLTFYSLSSPDDPSPEAQSFVLLLESARRDFQDWVDANATLPSGGNDPISLGS